MGRRKKFAAIMVTVLLIWNVTLVAASIFSPFNQSARTARKAQTTSSIFSSAGLCIPIKSCLVCIPIVTGCTPTPTPIDTSTPIPTPGTTPTPGSISTATPPPVGTSTPEPSPGASSTPSATPRSLSPTSSFTLTATSIVGTDAHLALLPDALYPVLSFSTVTIEGMKIKYLSITLSVAGTFTGSSASIKTSLFQDIQTALASFTNKADLLTLALGGTVKTLTMTNVTLQVDRFVNIQTASTAGITVSFS